MHNLPPRKGEIWYFTTKSLLNFKEWKMDPRCNSSILKLAGREETLLVWVSFIFTVAPLQLDHLISQTFSFWVDGISFQVLLGF